VPSSAPEPWITASIGDDVVITATGACCHDGACLDTTATGCGLLGGSYRGDSTECAVEGAACCPPYDATDCWALCVHALCVCDNTSSPPNPAGCLDEYGRCINDCLKHPPLPRPPGACCKPDGTCVQAKSEDDCLHNCGRWGGEGVSCTPNPCRNFFVECPPPECDWVRGGERPNQQLRAPHVGTKGVQSQLIVITHPGGEDGEDDPKKRRGKAGRPFDDSHGQLDKLQQPTCEPVPLVSICDFSCSLTEGVSCSATPFFRTILFPPGITILEGKRETIDCCQI
jgi:hypothetical protein